MGNDGFAREREQGGDWTTDLNMRKTYRGLDHGSERGARGAMASTAGDEKETVWRGVGQT
jgi:hypothetical protein